MALKRLLTEEMVQISGAWVDANSASRKALLAVPELAGLVSRVDAAHAGLLGTQAGPEDPRLAALMLEANAVDLRHDATIRAMHMFLTAQALVLDSSGSADAAGKMLKLRDTLLPDGLQATQLTYRGEAGAAELLVKRMADDPSVATALQGLQVGGRSGADIVADWIESARKLGKLEDERAKLVPSAGPGDGSKVVAARNVWIRSVNALVANAELTELDKDAERLLFGPLRLAEKTADRRVKAPVDAAPAVAPEGAPAKPG